MYREFQLTFITVSIWLEVLRIPGLFKERLVILGLREDRGWKELASASGDQGELPAKGREQVTKDHAPGKDTHCR